MQIALRLSVASTGPTPAQTEPVSDHALITLIAEGDRRAMEVLFGRHNVRIYRFIARLTGDATLAEDVVSEVFLEVWRGAATFKARSQVSTWLLAIARHKALTSMRQRQDTQWDDEKAASIVDI